MNLKWSLLLEKRLCVSAFRTSVSDCWVMSLPGSGIMLWRETNPPCFCAASQHLEHLSHRSIRFWSTPCARRGIWASALARLWGRTGCQVIQSRCEETREDAVWSVWLTSRTATLWRWNTWVFLFRVSHYPPHPTPPMLMFDIPVVTGVMSCLRVMSGATSSTGTLSDSLFSVVQVSIFLDPFRIDWTGLKKVSF